MRHFHTAWTPPSLPDSIVLLGGDGSAARLTAERVPGNALFRFTKIKQNNCHIFLTDGGGFDISHPGDYTCGIPDARDTIVLTGGRVEGRGHNYVTRWVGGKIQSFYTTSIIRPVRLSS